MSARSEKVLVAGAAGRLGREVLAELKRRGLAARALLRDASRLDEETARGVELFAADARRYTSLEGVCEGATAVVSAMGASLRLGRTRDGGATYRDVDFQANLNLLAHALKARVRKFVYVSLHGAERLRGSAYVDAHEDFVRELKASGINYTIVRPTGFFYVFAEIFRMAARGRVVLVGDGAARTNPIHERDVARECVDAVASRARELPVGGPEVYTRRGVAELAFSVLGKRPKITSVPAGLMRALIKPLALFDRRLYEFFDFGVAVSTDDIVAPPAGTHTLREYFQQLKDRR